MLLTLHRNKVPRDDSLLQDAYMIIWSLGKDKHSLKAVLETLRPLASRLDISAEELLEELVDLGIVAIT